MRLVLILALGTVASTAGLALAAPPPGDPTIAQKGWTPPKTALGQPDLSGYWSNATMTPLMRNRKLTDKLTLSEKEAKGLVVSDTGAV